MRFDSKKTVLISDGKNKWREALNSIEQLRPSQIELLNDEGNLLRVTQVKGDPDASDDDDDGLRKGKGSHRDVEMARIVMEAGDRGAARNADAYGLAFDKMVELVQVLADRLTGMENAWVETLNARAAEVAAAGSGDPGDQAVGQLLTLAAGQQKSEATKAALHVVAENAKSKAKAKAKK